ncbi:ComEC/Rec2 family competence protein [Rhizobium gallicum]|uniref:hypothetical protein n=1 Tax=Rhizobium gallicum TaxID=56730 RepID=UPI001063FE82|nr:hypothetical protein [Rhizobium gallicum]
MDEPVGEPQQAKIRVRMYNVGFGDCFLLQIPGDPRPKRVVIDCGSLKNKHYNIQQISDQLIADVTDDDGVARIDLLVMSHRHADHISGFANKKWAAVEVGEVWMPWIESPTDPEAKKLWKKQKERAKALQFAVEKQATLGLALDPLLADVAAAALSNEDCLAVLHDGFAKKVVPKFYPQGDKVVEKIECVVLPGVDIFVLGPPRSRGALNQADPPTNQILLDGFNIDIDGNREKVRPFGEDWVDESAFWPGFDHQAIDEAASQKRLYEAVAAELDAELNNTSLILIFKIGEDYLLFPGDAQWGPWERVFADEQAVSLLSKVTFLKIGHHASHNATPATLLRDLVGKENRHDGKVRAMISMTPYSRWKGIPHPALLAELIKREDPFVISDAPTPVDGVTQQGDYWLEFEIG